MNDDLLTLYFYDDGLSAEERQQVARTLQSDAELAERPLRQAPRAEPEAAAVIEEDAEHMASAVPVDEERPAHRLLR